MKDAHHDHHHGHDHDDHDHEDDHGHDHHDHHHHGHGHHGHHHDTDSLSDGRLVFSVVLNLILTAVEVVVGILSGSLALLADAVHNFGDVGALIVAWIARRIARKQADARFTFGYRRAELVGAVINLTVLLVMAAFMVMEAVERFFNPQPIIANWVIIAASVAVVVDLGTVFLLWGMSRGNLNIRAAFIHNLTDAGASFAVILGALMVQQFGWLWVDPALCLGIAAYILFTALPMLRQSASILMNHVPPHLELSAIATTFETFDEVVEVHHLHVWEIDERVIGLEAHVVLREDLSLANLQPLSQKLRDELKHRWNVGHTTFEFEGPDAQCARRNC